MANPEHVAKLKQGVRTWNKWRAENPGVTPNLIGADLIEMNLRKANLSRCDLREVGLLGANRNGTDLNRAILTGADLRGACLYEAKLLEACLQDASLRLTDLVRSDFSGADLRRANLAMARLGFTKFSDANLSEVEGLETIKHIGPSSIGIDTIYKSQGGIPKIFLRGAGVPENFIESMASLVKEKGNFYSVFISYSHKDEEFAEWLHNDLQTKGVRCWYAPEDMPGGKKLHEEIDRAIRTHDKLLLILSEHSMKSEWVKTEIAKARKREVRDKRQVLFPIRLCSFSELRDWECFDGDTGKDSAREIREYFIPDLSNWKNPDAYEKAFERLLKDLEG